MKPNYITRISLFTILLCGKIITFAFPLLGDTPTAVSGVQAIQQEKVKQETRVSWSPRVQKILKDKKYGDVEYFQDAGYLPSNVLPEIVLYLSLALACSIIVVFVLVEIFKEKDYSMIFPLLIPFFLLYLSSRVAWRRYDHSTHRACLFLTNKGVLHIDNGRRGSVSWFPYTDIHRIDLLSYFMDNQQTLVIVPKIGSKGHYPSWLFPSLAAFETFYQSIINHLTQAGVKCDFDRYMVMPDGSLVVSKMS